MSTGCQTNKSKTTIMEASVADLWSSNPPPSLVTFQNPCNGEKRPYVMVDKTICELQSIAAHKHCYGAFLVGSRVVDDPNLYVLTSIDPLFFFLSHWTTPTSYQPLSQLMTCIPPEIATSVETSQLKHILQVMAIGEDELYYKLSVDKTLVWLKRKQEHVQTVLEQQEATKKRPLEAAFAASFRRPEQSENNAPPMKTEAAAVTSMSKEESIQIVCNYINETWTERFLKHCSVSPSLLQGGTRKRPRQEDVVVSTAATTSGLPAVTMDWHNELQQTTQPPKPPPAKLSVAAKKLAKVNTKGMKPMSSFFTIKKK